MKIVRVGAVVAGVALLGLAAVGADSMAPVFVYLSEAVGVGLALWGGFVSEARAE